MGVLTCDRSGCDSIMCEYHIPGIGDICNECKEEFKNNAPYYRDEDEMIYALKTFMEIGANHQYENSNEMIDEFFNNYSRYKNEEE